jgi:hypothetical protein
MPGCCCSPFECAANQQFNQKKVAGDAMRPKPDQWWRADFTTRLAMVNGLPGVIVDAPEGPVQTAAIEIEGGVIQAMYVIRNPDKFPTPPSGLQFIVPTKL